MLNKSEIILSDQATTFDGHVQPLIEAEPYDDETGDGYSPLERWLDRLYDRPIRNRWAA